jgi:hypothetical protein
MGLQSEDYAMRQRRFALLEYVQRSSGRTLPKRAGLEALTDAVAAPLRSSQRFRAREADHA